MVKYDQDGEGLMIYSKLVKLVEDNQEELTRRAYN